MVYKSLFWIGVGFYGLCKTRQYKLSHEPSPLNTGQIPLGDDASFDPKVPLGDDDKKLIKFSITQSGFTKVDIVMVVDNSSSMDEKN